MKQNCLKCNNCIHESICHFWVYENYPSDFYENCTQYQEERPKGNWIIHDRDIGGIHKIECPYCGYVKGTDFDGLVTLTFDRLPLFCENCGADMRGDMRD